MTRTGRVPRLMNHTPAPRLALNPADAARLLIDEGGLVRIESGDGVAILPATIDSGLRRAGRDARIADPRQVRWVDGAARVCGGRGPRIDRHHDDCRRGENLQGKRPRNHAPPPQFLHQSGFQGRWRTAGLHRGQSLQPRP